MKLIIPDYLQKVSNYDIKISDNQVIKKTYCKKLLDEIRDREISRQIYLRRFHRIPRY